MSNVMSVEPGRTDAVHAVPSVPELCALAYKYFPRWHPDRESLDDYLERLPHAPETKTLEDLVRRALDDNRAWNALLAEVREMFPDLWRYDGTPLGLDVPSRQLVLAYEYPPGSSRSRYLVFRLSFLAPIFDFYESEQDPETRIITRYLMPTPESSEIAQAIVAMITRRFGYTWLDPEIGATPVPGIAVGNLSPGRVTLADALFDGSRSW